MKEFSFSFQKNSTEEIRNSHDMYFPRDGIKAEQQFCNSRDTHS